MRYVVVHVANGNAHLYGAEVISRVIKFNERYDLKANPAAVFAELSQQMSVPQPYTLVLAGLSESDKVVGHLIAHIQELYGYRTAMIYQLEIDRGEETVDRDEMWKQGWDQILAWAEQAGCQAIRCWAMNGKLVEVFRRFGFADKDFHFCEVEI